MKYIPCLVVGSRGGNTGAKLHCHGQARGSSLKATARNIMLVCTLSTTGLGFRFRAVDFELGVVGLRT